MIKVLIATQCQCIVDPYMHTEYAELRVSNSAYEASKPSPIYRTIATWHLLAVDAIYLGLKSHCTMLVSYVAQVTP